MSGYPSAYGHTPSYRSYTSTTSTSKPSYPSTQGATRRVDFDLGSTGGFAERVSPLLNSEFDRHFSSLSLGGRRTPLLDSEFAREFSPLRAEPLLRQTSPLGRRGGAREESSYKAKNYSSVTSSTSVDGGIPHRESHSDTTHKSVRTGPSSTPHTSYSHSSSSFSSDQPYKSSVSRYSYNI
eukprot:GFUD01063425.1.p1 GENE.GFUD01063425.1~~GFUD01063425.1.p1  ORF type:complete len:192 (+),score=41.44 GFUD01063425.1:36-578(+)